MNKSLLLFIFLIVGCITTAEREDGETLKIHGFGKATWPDGTSIEGKPMIEFKNIEVDK
jgi:hypothetical protein